MANAVEHGSRNALEVFTCQKYLSGLLSLRPFYVVFPVALCCIFPEATARRLLRPPSRGLREGGQ